MLERIEDTIIEIIVWAIKIVQTIGPTAIVCFLLSGVAIVSLIIVMQIIMLLIQWR